MLLVLKQLEALEPVMYMSKVRLVWLSFEVVRVCGWSVVKYIGNCNQVVVMHMVRNVSNVVLVLLSFDIV